MIYEGEDRFATAQILTQFNVRYVVVGKLEREKFANLSEQKFEELGQPVFRSGDTVIYDISE